MALHLDAEPGDTIRIGPHTLIRLERKNGKRARLAIESNEDIAQYKAGDPVPELVRRRLLAQRQSQDTGTRKRPSLVLKRPK